MHSIGDCEFEWPPLELRKGYAYIRFGVPKKREMSCLGALLIVFWAERPLFSFS